MNLKQYVVGDVSLFYAQAPEERAAQNRAIREGYKKVLFECLTDDSFTTIRTNWGPNAKVSITVAKYGKDGKTVTTKPSIQIDRIEDGNEIPLQYNAYEWENHVLEFLVKACNNAYAYKTPKNMSQEAIEKAKKPLEVKSDTVSVPTSTEVTWTDVFSSSMSEYLNAFLTGMKDTRVSLTEKSGDLKKLDDLHSHVLTQAFTFGMPTGTAMQAFVDNLGSAQQVILPPAPKIGLYGKKTIRMMGENPDELTLVPAEETACAQPPAVPVSFLKRITSLFRRG